MCTVSTFRTLDYAIDYDEPVERKRWLGLTSCGLWAATLVYVGVCLAKAFFYSKGFEGIGWLAFAFVGSWIGCAAGALAGAAGVVVWHARHRFALTGLVLNLLTGAGPVTLMWLTAS